MAVREPSRRGTALRACLLAAASVAAAAFAGGPAAGFDETDGTLRIGSSGSLTGKSGSSREKGGLKTLKNFIKDETGLDNEIRRVKDWRQLGEKMEKGDVQIGVFKGTEFAWASEKYPKLKPLALAVNVDRYPVVFVVTRKDDPADGFAALKGHSLCLPGSDAGEVRLYVDRECEKAGKKPDAFFSKITSQESVEDALDDVVDGVVQAAAADQAALAAYKHRKPARFKQLKQVARSAPFPPPVIAYYGNHLDAATRDRFLAGLREAGEKEKGKTMLTLFRLTGFDTVPDDFGDVLSKARHDYPPPAKVE